MAFSSLLKLCLVRRYPRGRCVLRTVTGSISRQAGKIPTEARPEHEEKTNTINTLNTGSYDR